MLILAILTLGSSNFFFAGFYNEIYIRKLLRDGYIPSDEETKAKILKFIPDAFDEHCKLNNLRIASLIFAFIGVILNFWMGFMSVAGKVNISFSSLIASFDTKYIENFFAEFYAEFSGLEFVFGVIIILIAINIFCTYSYCYCYKCRNYLRQEKIG